MDINALSADGKTPLIVYSVSKVNDRKADDLVFLLENGADKTIKDNDGKTAYDYAVSNGNTELAELLKP